MSSSSVPASEKKASVDISCRGGESFVNDFFYKIYDTQRNELYRFYKDHSVVVWNGTRVTLGLQNLTEFFRALPPTQHVVQCLDSQPISNVTGLEAGSSMVVTVCGTVTYAGKEAHGFVQDFVLVKESAEGHFYVASDLFRFLS